MNRRNNLNIPSRFILFILTIFAVVLLFVSYTTEFNGGYIRSVSEAVFMPMQRGIASISGRILRNAEENATLEELIRDNKNLKEEIARLNSEISGITLRESELNELRGILELKNTYNEYKTTGAYVISASPSNWRNTFTIDKGREDGIKEGMNVLAGTGLIGIVTDTGKHHAKVRSIIDDSSNVSGMVSDTGDNLIVSGSLKAMTEDGMIEFSNLEDLEKKAKVGDAVVTSNISDKYLPGLLIGYIGTIEDDPNGLTKYGKLVPVADFKHLNEVLIIMTTKQISE